MQIFGTFSIDPTDISSCVGINTGYKSIVKLNICAQPMHQIFAIKYCILLKTSLSDKEWVTRYKYGSHDDSFQVWKKSLPVKILKPLVPLPWQPNLIKRLATGMIRKLTIQTREPIPTNTLRDPQFTYHEHDVSNMVYVSLTNYFVMVFTNCGKRLGWNIIQRLASRRSNENFLHINKIYRYVSC